MIVLQSSLALRDCTSPPGGPGTERFSDSVPSFSSSCLSRAGDPRLPRCAFAGYALPAATLYDHWNGRNPRGLAR